MDKIYRHEIKYLTSEKVLNEIDFKLSSIMCYDKHAINNGYYNIHSLYFDDYNNSLAFDNDLGINNRYKWRIRYYNKDNENIFLEKKIKNNGLGYKKRCRLTKEVYKNIMNDNLLYETMLSSQNDLLKQFIYEIITKVMRPKVIIDYERKAYIENISNVRITFDKNIRSSLEIDKFLDGNYLGVSTNESGYHILEVKYDYVLPSYCKKIIYNKKLNICSYSKYNLGRKKVEDLLL